MASNITNGGAAVGINKAAGVFASVTTSGGTVSYVTANDINTTAIAAGTKYSFTPIPTSPAAPVSLTFSAVGSTSMDVNWVDNSTTETFFIIKRSTAAGGPFAQVGTVSSATTGTTGTGYNFSSTGLFAGVTYYYQVEAANEGTAPSADLLGNQATTSQPNVISTASGDFGAPLRLG